MLPKLAYLTLCRSIQLLALLGRGDASRTWRSSSYATSSVCCAARFHALGWSPLTAPCSPRSAASSPEPVGRASSSSPTRCCAGIGGWSPAPGPTLVERDDRHWISRSSS
jgi:hypothetical protein